MESQELIVTLDNFVPVTELVILGENNDIIIISFAEIICITKTGKYCTVFTRDTCYRYEQELEQLLHDLPVNNFVRVHKFHVISLEHLYLLQGTVPLSKSYKSELSKKLATILDQQYHLLGFNSNTKHRK